MVCSTAIVCFKRYTNKDNQIIRDNPRKGVVSYIDNCMLIAGIDYSMNGPAICVFNGDSFSFNKCSIYYLTDTLKYAKTFLTNIHGESFLDYSGDCERYDTISDWVLRVCVGVEQVALEGYAYNATGRVFNIAENTGILKYKLYQQRIPVEIVEPTHVKKYATSKGNADKEMMVKTFALDTGLDLQNIISPNKERITSPVSDIVDSFYICKYLYKTLKGF